MKRDDRGCQATRVADVDHKEHDGSDLPGHRDLRVLPLIRRLDPGGTDLQPGLLALDNFVSVTFGSTTTTPDTRPTDGSQTTRNPS